MGYKVIGLVQRIRIDCESEANHNLSLFVMLLNPFNISCPSPFAITAFKIDCAVRLN